MDYNTQRSKIALPEYGRHIHKMIEWVKDIKDRDERNRQIMAVISVMGNLNPHLRDINDFRHKLWDHVQIISNFEIDIDSPYPIPAMESFQEKPRPIPYPSKPIRIRHYGRNTETMISAIIAQTDPELKELEIQALANHMKKVYLTWNKDMVTDEQIFRDINILSDGAISVDPESVKLCTSFRTNNGFQQNKSHQYQHQKNGKNGSKNNNGKNGYKAKQR